jgi:hypothetical protein
MQTCLLTTNLISLLLSFIRYHIRGNITAHSQRKTFRFNSRTLRISAILNKENLATKCKMDAGLSTIMRPAG